MGDVFSNLKLYMHMLPIFGMMRKLTLVLFLGLFILYQTFSGGLIVDFERRIIGITFFGNDTTHILPIEIMARCVKHFKKFRCYLFSLGLGYVICIVLFSFVLLKCVRTAHNSKCGHPCTHVFQHVHD